MAPIWTSLLVALAPILLVGVVAAIWRFSKKLDRNTDAVDRLVNNVGTLEADVQSLKNWRDLISAQVMARIVKE